jgi:hypothetical protein
MSKVPKSSGTAFLAEKTHRTLLPSNGCGIRYLFYKRFIPNVLTIQGNCCIKFPCFVPSDMDKPSISRGFFLEVDTPQGLQLGDI